MNCHSFYPNRTPRLQLTPGDTNWHFVGKAGTLYSSYAALEAAGDVPWPGRPDEFSCGIPFMDVRSLATGGVTDGSPVLVLTNSKLTPGVFDDMVSGSGQHMVFENDGVKILAFKATAATDIIVLFGMF